MKKINPGTMDWTPASSRRVGMSSGLRQAADDLHRFAREEARRKASLRATSQKFRFANLWGF